MASPPSTFATLRALHLVIGDALDDIQRVFAQNSLPEPPSTPPSQLSSPVFSSFPDGSSPTTSPFPTTPPTSFPPTPLSATFPSSQRSPQNAHSDVLLDYPSPDLPHVPDSTSEKLALHPDAASAASKIVAACGQMSNIVHKPFSTLCDAIMNYNLPACMRLVEHLHIVEILREADKHKQHGFADGQDTPVVLSPRVRVGPDLGKGAGVANPLALAISVEPHSRTRKNIGMYSSLTTTVVLIVAPYTIVRLRPQYPTKEGLHVVDITDVICSYAGKNYIDPSDLVHVLRLLSTHHIFRETAPDTFALNRVASLLDSGKSVDVVFTNPESKYDDTGGIPALVALMTDELFKAAAYLTEAFTGVRLPTPMPSTNKHFTASPTTLPLPSSHAANGAVPCVPATRSSSILTHIGYPEDQDIQPASCSPLSAPEKIHISPSGGTAEDSTKVEKKCPPSEESTKHQKLSAFSLAFHTNAPYFDWLENGGEDPLGGTGQGAGTCVRTMMQNNVQPAGSGKAYNSFSQTSFRLRRFSKAMTGTTGWEAPKAILSGFDWYSLPKGSIVIDVGGGIGSTTMILACALNGPGVDSVQGQGQDGVHDDDFATVSAHSSKFLTGSSLTTSHEQQETTTPKDDMNLRFVVQDKPVVTALGVEAWRSKFPEMLERGEVAFQDQDFFEPQSASQPHPAVYLLRVVLHDWPDELARRILINLRVASDPETRLVIAEHVLPLACVDEDIVGHVDTEATWTGEWTLNSVLAHVEGAERTLVPPPLLSNLGKASANAYWMDLTMHISLNGKERTLREFCALALSAGWRVTRMTRPDGSLFAYLVCEPIALSYDAQAIYNAIVLSGELATVVAVPSEEPTHLVHSDLSRHKRLPPQPATLLPPLVIENSPSRCTTPTFGSRTSLPKDEELQSSRTAAAKKWLKSKGLGVRGVVMQKMEKHREDVNLPTGGVAGANCDSRAPAPTPSGPSSHIRVWWKKSPANSTRHSKGVVHELNPNPSFPAPRAAARGRREILKSNDSPSTPSPRLSPVHHKWPSTESTALPISEISPRGPYVRRPSVASITRKLSFANFGRRSSVPDVTEPLPMPSPIATLTELAPPPVLQDDIGHLKHLHSLPMLRCSETTAASITAEQRSGRRRPSLSMTGGSPPPVVESTLPRRPDVGHSPKPGILKSRISPSASTQSSPHTLHSGESSSTPIPRRQRRVTLSNAPGGAALKVQTQDMRTGIPAAPEVKRVPSLPKLPRRLSIPMLRRKQSQTIIVSSGEHAG